MSSPLQKTNKEQEKSQKRALISRGCHGKGSHHQRHLSPVASNFNVFIKKVQSLLVVINANNNIGMQHRYAA